MRQRAEGRRRGPQTGMSPAFGSLGGINEMKMASLILGTAANQYGCFVPDLTRFLGTACEGTRQVR